MNQDILNEFKEAAKPLVDFIKKHYDPMTKVIVSDTHAEVVRSELGTPTGDG